MLNLKHDPNPNMKDSVCSFVEAQTKLFHIELIYINHHLYHRLQHRERKSNPENESCQVVEDPLPIINMALAECKQVDEVDEDEIQPSLISAKARISNKEAKPINKSNTQMRTCTQHRTSHLTL